jgi:hypothetical protein
MMHGQKNIKSRRHHVYTKYNTISFILHVTDITLLRYYNVVRAEIRMKRKNNIS